MNCPLCNSELLKKPYYPNGTDSLFCDNGYYQRHSHYSILLIDDKVFYEKYIIYNYMIYNYHISKSTIIYSMQDLSKIIYRFDFIVDHYKIEKLIIFE